RRSSAKFCIGLYLCSGPYPRIHPCRLRASTPPPRQAPPNQPEAELRSLSLSQFIFRARCLFLGSSIRHQQQSRADEMDLLCDNIVEEILLRLPLKYLHRLRAAARRYNALVLGPEFTARYWRSLGPHLSGVFLQTEFPQRPWRDRPCFLTASGHQPSTMESVFAADIAFLPHLPHKEAYSWTTDGVIFIVHSSAGLLLCARGRGEESRVHYYVCNPVTWQCVALPKLPWPGYHTGLLSVSANGDGTINTFQVALVNRPSGWHQHKGCLDLKIFSSDTGQWWAMQLHPPELRVDAPSRPFLGQSGTAYWIGYHDKDKVIAYNSVCHSVRVLPVPTRVAENALNRCLGERQDGGLRYAHFDFAVFEVWDLQTAGENGMWWKLVHRIGVMELAQQNPEAADYATNGGSIEGHINGNCLFEVIGFHPIDDIVYFDVRRTVAIYSIVHSTIELQRRRQCFSMDVFPYVHPAHPVLIPEIKNSNMAPSKSKTPDYKHGKRCGYNPSPLKGNYIIVIQNAELLTWAN
ncbi:hypothetical protein EJB05_16030, partial [Eragrostis curvula]